MNPKLTRVTCTIPSDLLRRADADARRQGRSRSWLLSEATRRYLSQPAGAPIADHASTEFETARAARRDLDLRLSPEQRVHEAERLSDEAIRATRIPSVRLVAQFDTFENYFAWSRRRV